MRTMFKRLTRSHPQRPRRATSANWRQGFETQPSWAPLLLSLGLLGALQAPQHALAQAQTPAAQHLSSITLGAGIRNIQVEVARTSSEQEIGLMSRSSMPTDAGMLFEFPQASVQCFWMKNTLIPLSVAFIDDQGRIVNIEDMQPMTLNPHCSKQPVRHVLEMNLGWFKRRGMKLGSQFRGEPFGSAL